MSVVLGCGLILFPHSSLLAQTTGDVAAGKKRAAVCFACHGVDGIARMPRTPNLAGQDADYLEGALKEYRDGSRADPAMRAMARPLTDKDIADISAYFNALVHEEGAQ